MDDIQLTNQHQESEEDKLLDPIAKSILHDLQLAAVAHDEEQQRILQEAAAGGTIATRVDEDGIHFESTHDGPNPTLQERTDEETLKCDPTELTESEMRHCQLSLELDVTDSIGFQGGQDYRPPTLSPSNMPNAPSGSPIIPPTISPSSSPSEYPTFAPTARGDPFVLYGTIWYDRNANGKRDSNIDTPGMGKDVEYTFGLGGVSIQLMECDPVTNKPITNMDKYSDGDNSYAMTTSRGYDVNYRAQLANRNGGGGNYNLVDIKVDRSYFIWAKAPAGYILTGGVCNDDIPGKECPTSSAKTFAFGYNRRRFLRDGGSNNRFLQRGNTMPSQGGKMTTFTEKEMELGVTEGRSIKCTTVDRQGMPDSRLDIGAMRGGDVEFASTEVDLNLNLIKPELINGKKRRLREGEELSLLEMIQESVLEGLYHGGRDLQSQMVKIEDGGYSYELKEEDKTAIGKVTSEVLASNLDRALLKNGVVLDTVSHLSVLYIEADPEVDESVGNSTNAANGFANADATAASAPDGVVPSKRRNDGGKLQVNLLVRGHYNQNLNVNFDLVVQDSINRETHAIRRQLTYYNQNCRDQTTKVLSEGFTLDDFLEVHTNKGVKKPVNRKKRDEQVGEDKIQAFSAACEESQLLPEYFEASLGGFKLRAQSEGTTYSVDEGGSSAWAIVGIIVAMALFAIGVGFLLFQRGLKKKQEKAREARVTHIATRQVDEEDFYLDSIDEKLDGSRDMKEKMKSKGMMMKSRGKKTSDFDQEGMTVDKQGTAQHKKGFAGLIRRELHNVTAVLTSELGKGKRERSTAEMARQGQVQSGSGPQSKESGSTSDDYNENEIDEDEFNQITENAAEDLEFDEIANNAAKQLKGVAFENNNDMIAENASKKLNPTARTGNDAQVDLTMSCTSRNTFSAPQIVQMEFESEDESSSSSEDESSSSSSGSSSDDSDDRHKRRRTAASKRNEKKAKIERKKKRSTKTAAKGMNRRKSEEAQTSSKARRPKDKRGTRASNFV